MAGSITICSNLAALSAERRLAQNTKALAASYTRLSSGLRINRAGDDAAGLSISELLNTDARVFAEGLRNVNDGISLINIAEGALQELTSITTRQRELATQAANGTLSTPQRQALNEEANALVNEFNRIVSSTTFNGINLLDPSSSALWVQGGYGANGSVAFDLAEKLAQVVINGTFAAAVSSGFASSASSVATADFNGDGITDLATADGTVGSISILIGNGDGTFQKRRSYWIDANLSVTSITAADLNADGITDLAASFYSTATGNLDRGFVSVFTGNGDGTFTTGSATMESSSVTFKSGVLTSGGSFFFLGSTASQYYVWYQVSGSGSDPVCTGKTGIMVNILSSDTANQVAQKTATVLAAYDDLYCGTPSAGTMTISCATAGQVVDVQDPGNALSSFSVLTEGGRSSNFSTSYKPCSVTSGDYNGDGILDLITANYGNSTASVLLGNGNGTFKAGSPDKQQTINATFYAGSHFAGSMFSLAISSIEGNYSLWYRCDGSGSGFLPAPGTRRVVVDVLSSDTANQVAQKTKAALEALGDFTCSTPSGGTMTITNVTAGDVPSYSGGSATTTSTLTQQGSAANTFTTGGVPYSIRTADFNGDGIKDFATADSGHSVISVALGNGNGTFRARSSFATGSIPRSIIFGDFNSDGSLDLATADASGNCVSVFLGNGNGTFKARRSFTAGSSPRSVTITDCNADGIQDLVTADNTSNCLSVFVGNGDGTFYARTSYATGAAPSSVCAADINGDGAPDLAAGIGGIFNISTLLGNTHETSTMPYLNLCTADYAREAMATIDATLERVTSQLGALGAVQSRLGVAVNTLGVSRENYLSASSQITNVDVAEESANLVKQRILQSAAAAVLAQANQEPEIAQYLCSRL